MNFFKKQGKEIGESEVCPNPLENKVECDECKCWLDKSDASTVSATTAFGTVTYYYCRTHKKPYSKIQFSYTFDTPARYFGEVEMTEDGVPVGYESIGKNILKPSNIASALADLKTKSGGARKRGRAKLTEEERKRRNRLYAKRWYRKHKKKLAKRYEEVASL